MLCIVLPNCPGLQFSDYLKVNLGIAMGEALMALSYSYLDLQFLFSGWCLDFCLWVVSQFHHFQKAQNFYAIGMYSSFMPLGWAISSQVLLFLKKRDIREIMSISEYSLILLPVALLRYKIIHQRKFQHWNKSSNVGSF